MEALKFLIGPKQVKSAGVRAKIARTPKWRRRILTILAHLKSSNPPLLLSHHLRNQILVKMLFLNPSSRSWDVDCNQISAANEEGDFWVWIWILMRLCISFFGISVYLQFHFIVMVFLFVFVFLFFKGFWKFLKEVYSGRDFILEWSSFIINQFKMNPTRLTGFWAYFLYF